MRLRRITCFGFLVFILCSFLGLQNARATFMGKVPTGLIHSQDDPYGYSYYVPTNYTPDRAWPFVVGFHNVGSNGEKYIQEWVDWAERRGVIVLCPTYTQPRTESASYDIDTYEEPRDMPYDLDKRNLKLVKQMMERYEIDQNQILLMGSGYGGHYSVYLGLRYPQYFPTAVVSIGNGFKGPYEKVLSFSYAKVNQPFFLILVHQKDAGLSVETDKTLKFYKDKGYFIEVVNVDTLDKGKTPSLYPYILDWFGEIVPKRKQEIASSGGIKQGFLKLIDQKF